MLYNGKEINLYVGLVVKNYQEMCMLLEESIKTSNSKKAQINQWKRYFDFVRDGHKFVIIDVYPKPLPPNVIRRRRDGIYVLYIEYLLMDILTNPNEYGKLVITKKRLFEILGMVNAKYSKFFNEDERKLLVDNINEKNLIECKIENRDINNFYKYAGMELSHILTRSLDSMENRKLIIYHQTHIIIFKDDSLNSNNDGYRNSYSNPGHIAEDKEEKVILNLERRALCEMGFDNMKDVIWRGRIKEYQCTLDRIVSEEMPEWKYVFPVYYILYNDNIKEQMPLQIDKIVQLSTQQVKLELNSKICERMEQMIQDDYDKKEKEIEEYKDNDGWGYNPMEKQPFSYKKDHVSCQKLLISYMLEVSESV